MTLQDLRFQIYTQELLEAFEAEGLAVEVMPDEMIVGHVTAEAIPSWAAAPSWTHRNDWLPCVRMKCPGKKYPLYVCLIKHLEACGPWEDWLERKRSEWM